jgi:hydrogenase expression/formation protein HypD
MKYIDEFRDQDLIISINEELRRISRRDIVLMEVCGGHTMAIHRFGLNSLLPPNIRLVSGPGCPVCVTSQKFIDLAIEISKIPGVIIATYGDLVRVPGSSSSLEKERGKGADIRIIYSVLESLEIARHNPGKKIVFPGIGFETTAPSTAVAITKARQDNLKNFFVLSAHKVMPPVMEALVKDGVKLNGFIAPGHVTAITGISMYNNLVSKHGLGVVVAGFEPADIMHAVLMLAGQIESGSPAVEVQYRRVVNNEGNIAARKILEEVFEYRDDTWRGLGKIQESGLGIGKKYSSFDAENHFSTDVPEAVEPLGCICADILRGLKTPRNCSLFGGRCTPSDPVGACMVSTEGTCATYYKYR